MTLWSRAIIGALIGAIVTLLVHPSSRPYLAGPFVESSNLIEGYALPTSFPATLPEPNDEISASLWIHVGAEQIKSRSGLTKPQVEGLAKIARSLAQKDAENSFWKMAEAIFCANMGDRDTALAAWKSASTRTGYNDYQSQYLSKLRESLSATSATSSWQYAYCYRLRSFAFSTLVESFARGVVANLTRVKKPDLELRYVTILNGGLLRDGSRNLEVMQKGISIVELGSHPQGLQSGSSIRRLLIAHSEFKEALKSNGMWDQAQKLDSLYNTNDAWNALTKRENTSEKMETLTVFSALWPNLPGVLLQIAIVGFSVWLLGLGMEKLVNKRYNFAIVLSLALAIGLAIAVWVLTTSWLALLSTILCCIFILISPKQVRSHSPNDLGPLFVFAVMTVAAAFILLEGIMFLTRTLPVTANVHAFDSQLATIVDFRLAAGLSLIIVACLYLFAPLWALAQHIKTLFVLGRGLRTFGAITAITCLVAAIAATPICVYLENENQHTLNMLLGNEPLYYYMPQ